MTTQNNKNVTPSNEPRNANNNSIRRRDASVTRQKILETALQEFSDKGMEGARVDAIAENSATNKRMIYHYFGNKEGLYLAVLEKIYSDLRSSEANLDLSSSHPLEAITAIIDFAFNYFLHNRHAINIINNENLHKAAHLKQSDTIEKNQSAFVNQLECIVKKGTDMGIFTSGIDPVQLHFSIASLCYCYLSSSYTLGVAFGKDLLSEQALEERLSHIKELILGYLRKA